MGKNAKECRLSYSAYAKLMLHAAKHGNAMVLGFLTGTASADGTHFAVHNAFPLFHTAPLPALLESAAALVDSYLEESDGDEAEGEGAKSAIVGVYFAPGDSVAPDANGGEGASVAGGSSTSSALTIASGRLGVPGAVCAIADAVRAANGGSGCVLKVDCEALRGEHLSPRE